MDCLETSFLIDVLRRHEPARDLMEDLDASGRRLTVTPVAASELWVGAEHGSLEEQEATGALLESLTWLPFTREAAHRAGSIRTTLTKDGNPIGITDAMIAAVSLEHDQRLVTRDTHFDRIPGLRIRRYG